MPPTNLGAELLSILLEAGRITEEQYRALTNDAASTGKPVEALLLERKLVDDEFLARAKGTMLGVPYAELAGKDIPVAVLNLIPKNISESVRAIAFEKTDEHVGIGMVDPRDVAAMQTLDFLSQNLGFKPKYHIMSVASFNSALKKYASIGKDVAGALEV